MKQEIVLHYRIYRPTLIEHGNRLGSTPLYRLGSIWISSFASHFVRRSVLKSSSLCERVSLTLKLTGNRTATFLAAAQKSSTVGFAEQASLSDSQSFYIRKVFSWPTLTEQGIEGQNYAGAHRARPSSGALQMTFRIPDSFNVTVRVVSPLH